MVADAALLRFRCRLVIATLALCALCAPLTLTAKVEIRANQTAVSVGAPFALQVIATQDGELGDIASILGSAFRITQQSQSRNVQVFNGQTRVQNQWDIVVEPLREGTFTLGPVRINNEVSNTLTLRVAAAQNTQTANNIILLGEVDTLTPYIQSQVVYRLKLLYANRQSLLNGQVDVLRVDGVDVYPLAQNKRYRTVHQGKNYLVSEWRYAFIPKTSGPLNIPQLRFVGQAIVNNRRQTVRLFSDALTLDVRPRPAAWPQGFEWLPAKNLTLWEKWQPTERVWQQGQAVVREVHMAADGARAEQLAEIALSQLSNVQVYPEPPARNNNDTEDGMRAEYHQILSYLANAGGQITLPEIRVPWWDTAQDTLRYSTLPARTIEVLPAVGASTENNRAPSLPDAAVNAPVDATPKTPSQAAFIPFWLYALMGLLAITNAITLTAFWRARRGAQSGEPTNSTKSEATLNATIATLNKALKNNDARTAYRALLPITNMVFNQDTHTALTKARAALETAIYTHEQTDWQPPTNALITHLAHHAKTTKTNVRPLTIAPLYPTA